VVGTATGRGQVVPFYLLPSLGGKNTLRGYSDYRFHDRALSFFSVESRWAIWRHVDAAVFYDGGKVAPRISDLGLAGLKRSIGAGIRVHNSRAIITRLDFGRSDEGWHVGFKMSPSLSRSTPDSGRPSAIPFVP
jgi:outer membrane protein assembly factor BamA